MPRMVGVEIYAGGLDGMGKVPALDRHFVEFTGLPYKLDINHDIVYLRFDEPILSILGLQSLLSARFRPSFSREGNGAVEREKCNRQSVIRNQNETLRTPSLTVH